MRWFDSNKKESDMNPFRTPPSRTVGDLVTRYRKHRGRLSDIRVIEQLPVRVRKDIGWPPFGNLDERSSS